MNRYLNPNQKKWITHAKNTWLWRSEWPTWLIIFMIYFGGYLCLSNWKQLGLIGSGFILLLLLTWYMSLQHELLHGHPTRWAQLNRLLGLMPFTLGYPYDLYKQQHLIHHTDQYLTDPILDPESNYIDQHNWSSQHVIIRTLYTANRTLAGRLLFGPFLSLIQISQHIIDSFRQKHTVHIKMWLQHFILVGLLLWSIDSIFHYPIYSYVLISYFALSIALLRSFYEHRPADHILARTVINEAELPFRLLFLDNNYHVIHHDLPHAPWFMLKTIFKRNQDDYLRQNQAFYFRGYLPMLKQHSIKSIDSPILQRTQVFVREHLKQINMD